MREEDLGLLASPCCTAPLSLRATRRYALTGHVEEGALSCSCGAEYLVQRGVPSLVTPASAVDPQVQENRRTWNFIWEKVRGLEGNYFTSEEMFNADFCLPNTAFRGSRVVEVGMATGKYLDIFLNRGARQVFALDISDEIYSTADAFAKRGEDRVCFVHCDLARPPLKAGAFDTVICARVLHHLPDMAAGLAALYNRLKPGGRLSVVLYGRSNNDGYIRAVEAIKPFLRRLLGLQGLFVLSALPTAVVYALSRGLYAPLGRYAPRTAARLPLARVMEYWGRLGFRPLMRFIIFDILAAPITQYLDEAELRGLTKGLPEADIRIKPLHEAMWNLDLTRHETASK